MKVQIRELEDEYIPAVLALKVKDEQKPFVASNVESLEDRAEAMKNGYKVPAFMITADDIPVGFLMLSFGNYDPSSFKGDSWYVWRFMVDEHYQGRGIGRRAMELALSYMKVMPFGETERIYISYEKENTAAERLYSSLGFVPTGEYDDGETVALLDIKKLLS